MNEECREVILCVAPSGGLELWHLKDSWIGSMWVLSDSLNEDNDIKEIDEDPEFWGREQIDSWIERIL